jgi:hypothetical protein
VVATCACLHYPSIVASSERSNEARHPHTQPASLQVDEVYAVSCVSNLTFNIIGSLPITTNNTYTHCTHCVTTTRLRSMPGRIRPVPRHSPDAGGVRGFARGVLGSGGGAGGGGRGGDRGAGGGGGRRGTSVSSVVECKSLCRQDRQEGEYYL